MAAIITDPNLPVPPASARPKAGKKPAGVPIIAPRVDAATLKPSGSLKIKRAGLGVLKRDGRRSGGQFSVKRLTILDTVETSIDDYTATPEAERKDLPGVRTLCVPLHMDPTGYPSVRDTEAVMDEDEDMYDTEQARDRVLSVQVDPFWVNPKTGATEPRNLGFGSFDPAAKGNSDPNAGKAWWTEKATA